LNSEVVFLAAEDELGIAAGRKLIDEVPPLSVFREFRGAGYARLRDRCTNYEAMAANGLPVLLLTDLDAAPCPAVLIQDWLGRQPHPEFLFRICVREVEAWLLADSRGLADYLGVSAALIPRAPEGIDDPKRELLNIAARSRRAVRARVRPRESATIGPGYNAFFGEFVRDHWSPVDAARRSPSLERARGRLAALSVAARRLQEERNS
jgi:hypothetical protein